MLPRVIVGTSILATGGSLGLELYLKQHGCCDPYPEACTIAHKYKTQTLPALIQKGKDIDYKYAAGKNNGVVQHFTF